MTIQRLKIDDLEITVVRKPIKNMYLRVRRHGEIEISASPRVEIETIESFIQADFKKERSYFKFSSSCSIYR